jgi:LPXTG-motif cell wall-anchored protein
LELGVFLLRGRRIGVVGHQRSVEGRARQIRGEKMDTTTLLVIVLVVLLLGGGGFFYRRRA